MGDSANRTNVPVTGEDPLIHYGFYAGLILASLCLCFAVVYIFIYSKTTTLSFEQHTSEFLDSNDINDLTVVLIARTAQNKTLLQSCGIVAGVAFGFLGFSLFLLGIKGETDASGKILANDFSFKKLAPGALIMIGAMTLVGICSIHPIELHLGPDGSSTGTTRNSSDPSREKEKPASKTFVMPPTDNSKP